MPEASQFWDDAFVSNRGLLTAEEQAVLRRSVIAIPGMGGVGGQHLLTLARLGIGGFSIADADTFELRNLNRQPGATMATLGRRKTEVMAELARAVNPHLALRALPEDVGPSNIDRFLEGCQLVVDGIDFFRIQARRLVFRRARELGLPVVTCGPIGFSAALLVFMPDGPSFDDYLGLREGMDPREQLLRFAIGLAPAGLHLPYLDRTAVDFTNSRAPASSIAVALCAGVAAVEVLNLLLKRRPPLAVPRYAQFDPYRLRYRRGRVWGGHRHPMQQLKLWYLKRAFRHAV
jgi:molybdopterin/thiamine biosynthesis adenylyltransferase